MAPTRATRCGPFPVAPPGLQLSADIDARDPSEVQFSLSRVSAKVGLERPFWCLVEA